LIGCERKSALEQAAEAERDEDDARVQHVYAKLPPTAEVPPGVPKALWADVGWFPESTYELTSIRRELAFVNWLRDTLNVEMPDCASMADGIDRYYMVRTGEPSPTQTLVFYGTVDRVRVEACVRRFATFMGGAEVRTDGELLIIGSARAGRNAPQSRSRDELDQQVVAWVQAKHETVVILAPSYRRAREFLEPTATLVNNVGMVGLLREPPFDGDNLMLGLEDHGSVLLGIPSTGFKYRLAVSGPTKSMNVAGKLLFASESEATKAEAGAQLIARELADLGIEVEVHGSHVEQHALNFDVSIPLEWAVEPDKAKAVLDMLERRRVDAGLGSASRAP
jgi:hypothetical protein